MSLFFSSVSLVTYRAVAAVVHVCHEESQTPTLSHIQQRSSQTQVNWKKMIVQFNSNPTFVLTALKQRPRRHRVCL